MLIFTCDSMFASPLVVCSAGFVSSDIDSFTPSCFQSPSAIGMRCVAEAHRTTGRCTSNQAEGSRLDILNWSTLSERLPFLTYPVSAIIGSD